MCGIAGFFNYSNNDGKTSEVIRRLVHRGPDAQDSYVRESVGLLHTRLAILDLSSFGAQPYRYEHLVLVFNGEIYNFREIRSELKTLGYTFESNSDTEVVIKSFHQWREKCVDRFIGMFAFAVYDENSKDLFLFRDRVGVKPLYYSYQNGAFLFASELHALRAFENFKEIDIESVSLYFRFGFIPAPRSIFTHVSKLPQGHYMRVSTDGIELKRFWDVEYRESDGKSEQQWLEELEALLISAFRYRMVSDVPVGVFLSGGIDSSLLTAILQKHHGGIHTFNIGFAENRFDESVFAERVASHLGTNHVKKILDIDEARKLLSSFYSIYDEPFADTSGIPTACVTELAKQHGMKVVLSADGGDELFGGYTHYLRSFRMLRKIMTIPSGLRNALARAVSFGIPPAVREKLIPLNMGHKVHAWEEIMSSSNTAEFFENTVANQSMKEIRQMIPNATLGSTARAIRTSEQQQMMAWDFDNYLPDDLLVKIDRATMFHSLECREPFLDHRVVEFAATIPMEWKIRQGRGKYLLRKLLERYMPPSMFERPKQGFSIPIFKWFQKDLDGMFENYLSEEKLKSIPFFDSQAIRREYNRYRIYKENNKEYNIEKMWRILSFMLWWEKHMQHGA